MHLSPFFTSIRSYLSYQFSTTRRRALRSALWAKLRGMKTGLAAFPEEAPEKSPNRRFLGIQDVPVQDIIGTINRQNDFDSKFRPLNLHLQDRWINAYLALQSEGWSPILVHKVGNKYYVEDGHHRVSIAQPLGMTLIPAKVWEHPSLAKQPKRCLPEPCPERSAAQVLARVNE